MERHEWTNGQINEWTDEFIESDGGQGRTAKAILQNSGNNISLGRWGILWTQVSEHVGSGVLGEEAISYPDITLGPTLLSRVSHWTLSEANSQPALIIFVSLLPVVLGVQAWDHTWLFSSILWDSNSGPHDCIASTLPTEQAAKSSLHPPKAALKRGKVYFGWWFYSMVTRLAALCLWWQNAMVGVWGGAAWFPPEIMR